PGGVERAQRLAVRPPKVIGLVSQRLARRRLGRARSFEARPDLSLERGQPSLVERLGGVLFDLVAESVGVVVRPRKQPGSRLVRVGARRLPGFDPPADEIAYELSKGAARIVELFGLLVAASEERLVERGSADRVGPGELRDRRS